jgi:hypothetical protein
MLNKYRARSGELSACCLRLAGNLHSTSLTPKTETTLFRNAGRYLPDYAASQLNRLFEPERGEEAGEHCIMRNFIIRTVIVFVDVIRRGFI